jgi:hypothetical protein
MGRERFAPWRRCIFVLRTKLRQTIIPPHRSAKIGQAHVGPDAAQANADDQSGGKTQECVSF